MKKLLTILLTVLMILSLAGCNSKTIEEPVDIDEPKQQDEQEPVVGGFVEAEDSTITAELQDIFDLATKGLLGASYKPLKLVASQVVAGTNYKFLAEGSKTTNPITRGTYYITVYKDLDGNCTISDIEVIEEYQEESENLDIDYTKLDYWVIYFDQHGNLISRYAVPYGSTVQDPNTNKEVIVKGNVRFFITLEEPVPVKKYIVSFDTQGKGEAIDAVKIANGSLITRPADPDVSGYIIAGWYKEAECTNEWNFDTDKVTKDITLYAKWIQTGLFANGVCYQELTLENCGTDTYKIKNIANKQENTLAVLPHFVTSIGSESFIGETWLTSIIIPYGVTSIENRAFESSGLKSATIPGSVETLGQGIFFNCSDLTSATISSGVTSIGLYMFSGCSNLNSINLPNTLTSIGGYAFNNCSNLNSIIIPNGVDFIGEYAFAGTNLSSVNIPGTVTSIEPYAFYFCNNLSSATILEGVKTIGEYAFDGTSLSSLTIPSSLVSIGNNAFNGCYFDSINLPNGLKTIGENAFSSCSNLSSATLPSSLTTIGANAFNFTGLQEAVIPGSVANISSGAFANNGNLTSLTIKEGVETIEYGAFGNCAKLEAVTIPSSVNSIGDSAFSYCNKLNSVTICDGVKTIGNKAFSYCFDTLSITMPSSLTSLGGKAFVENTVIIDYAGTKANFLAIASNEFSNEWYADSKYITIKCTDGTMYFDATGDVTSKVELEQSLSVAFGAEMKIDKIENYLTVTSMKFTGAKEFSVQQANDGYFISRIKTMDFPSDVETIYFSAGIGSIVDDNGNTHIVSNVENKLDVYLPLNCKIGAWAFENCNDVVLHYPGSSTDFYKELDDRTYNSENELKDYFGAYKVTVICDGDSSTIISPAA